MSFLLFIRFKFNVFFQHTAFINKRKNILKCTINIFENLNNTIISFHLNYKIPIKSMQLDKLLLCPFIFTFWLDKNAHNIESFLLKVIHKEI